MNIFKAVLFAGMVLASQATAQTFVRFHSGVNLSVAPGGSDRSAAPLDVQEATNAQRVAEAADIGFDFIRLRVSLAPWTDTGSTADQQRGLTLANGIIQQALAYGMRVDVVMMAGSLSTTTAAGLICTANPSAVAAWTAGWQAVLALLPDTFHVAFEPLNEPPNCAEGTTAWDAAQLSLYHQVRTLRRAIKFVVYGHHWGDNVGTDFTSLPVPCRHKCPVYVPLLRPIRVYRAGPLVAARWALPLFDWFDVALRYCQCAGGAGQRSWARGARSKSPTQSNRYIRERADR